MDIVLKANTLEATMSDATDRTNVARSIEREANRPVSQGFIEMLKKRGVSAHIIRAIEHRNDLLRTSTSS